MEDAIVRLLDEDIYGGVDTKVKVMLTIMGTTKSSL